jgi:hypothetical protein
MAIFRPAYQDELDEIQADLKILYDEYVIKLGVLIRYGRVFALICWKFISTAVLAHCE